MANIEGEMELLLATQGSRAPVSPTDMQNVYPDRGTKRHTLSSQVDEFAPLVARIDQAVARVRTVNERINGTRPRPVERATDETKASEPSIMLDLRNKRDLMVRLLDQLDRELSSLEECL